MKLILKLLAFAVLVSAISFFSFNVGAEEALSAELYVSISDKGEIAVSHEKITVTDIDADGALTINDTLFAAHQAYYSGGAANGYAFAETEYGISIVKLWGDTSGSYGYYLNDASAWSLADTVKDGDYVCAYIYSDTVGWSDSYTFFDKKAVNAESGEEITLTLSVSGYDDQCNVVTLPLKSAKITVNGEKTEFVTDENGKVTLMLEEEGSFVISAVSDETVIVPPVCVVNVSANENEGDEEIPKPGDNGNIILFVIIAAASLGTAFIFAKVRRIK